MVRLTTLACTPQRVFRPANTVRCRSISPQAELPTHDCARCREDPASYSQAKRVLDYLKTLSLGRHERSSDNT
jgi:hypothetical protein